MSTTSTRRLKERPGGGGGKIIASMPTKTLTLISEKSSFGSARKSSSKENPNPRSISRVSGPTQKPETRPMPRMSSFSSGDNGPKPRSRPRGRSPINSDFTLILSDLHRTRVSGGDTSSNWEKGFRELGQKVDEKGVDGFRVCTDRKGNANYGGKFRDLCEKDTEKIKSDGNRSSGLCRKESNLSANSVKLSANGVNYALDGCLDHCRKDGNISRIVTVMACEGECANQNLILKDDRDPSMENNESELNIKGLDVKSVSNLKGSDVCKDKGINEVEMSAGVGNKHTSQLHEKLAYLDRKVKRIAYDIKKTKEMLDMDNSDASKMILLDIQEKISGIEKAMCNVKIDPCSDLVDAKLIEIDSIERSMYRDSSKIVAFGSQSDGTLVSKSNRSSNLKNSSSPIDENPIELEFLASLNKMQSEVIAADRGGAPYADEVRETDDAETSTAGQSSGISAGKQSSELDLQANERFDEFDDQENKPKMIVEEEMDDNSISQLREIGHKTSTGGWFVSEGESVLLTHDDGSCSFYDIVNQEEKAEYRPPAGISQNIWRDCWIIRALGADGCSGKYVVAASAGNSMDSGFCSWDFYTKDVQAFHTEDNIPIPIPRVALGPLPDNVMYRRNPLGASTSSENQQWWYRPCGPLIISTSSCQRTVKVFDIRDGEQIMKWDVLQSPVLAMDYCSPLQWRNRGKVVVAETEAISLWDVSSLNPQPLSSVSTSGHRISALHVNNTDAELGGGVRQRVSSSEAEGNDGVFCTADSINVLDFRHPSGIGLKIPKIGVNVQTVSSRGDSVFLGCSSVASSAKKQVCSQILQFSLRRQRLVNAYSLPESNAHWHHKALTQVWGNSNLVMAVCGLGLFVFDASTGDVMPSFGMEYSNPQKVKQVIGPDDMYSPSFDYISSQILLISRDRPAVWRHLS